MALIPYISRQKKNFGKDFEERNCGARRNPAQRRTALQAVWSESNHHAEGVGELVLDGLIIRKAGRGTFVLPKRRRSFSVHLIGNFDELVTCGVHSRMKLLRQEVIDASPEIREKLTWAGREGLFL